jgi:hypothetical protein
MTYFDSVPNILYKLNSNDYKLAKNLFRRLKIRGSENSFAISTQKYTVQPFEKIEQVAFKFYGDPAYWWVIAIVNNIIDIRGEWYATQDELNQLYTNTDYIVYYETIQIKDSSGFIRVPAGLIVSSGYTQILLSGSNLVQPVTFNFDIFRKNEAKREINILLPQYLDVVRNELENLLDYNTTLNVVNGVKLTG